LLQCEPENVVIQFPLLGLREGLVGDQSEEEFGKGRHAAIIGGGVMRASLLR
jgi:hypothetical protein